MSESGDRFLDVLLKNVKCFMCLDNFKDPRLLDCHHSFCLNCLAEYFETLNGDYIECPLCDGKTERPKSAKSLRKNIYMDEDGRASAYCSVCGNGETAKSFCVECQQNFCRSCIRSHGTITATREHHLVTLDKNKKIGLIKRDLFCKIHEDEKEIYFCMECEKLVCKHCNLTTHKNHETRHASEIAEEWRDYLQYSVENTDNKNYAMWLADRRENFSSEVEKCKNVEKKAITDINERADLIISMVREIKTKLVAKSNSITKRKLEPLKEKMNTFEKLTSSFSHYLLHSLNLCRRADDVEIVNSAKDIIGTMEDTKQKVNIPTFQIGSYSVFKPGYLSLETLMPLFGDVSLGDNMEKNSLRITDFKTETSGPVMSIMPRDDLRSWVVEGDGDLKLYDTLGKVHRQVKLGIHADDAIETEDYIVVSGNSSKKIKVLDKRLNEIAKFDMDLCCRGITFDSSDASIYLCLTEKNAFFDHDPTHRNKIVRLLTKGKRLETPKYLAFAGSPTVEYPARLAFIKPGLLVVSDWKQSCITILNKAGYIDRNYLYNKDGHRICPRGICSDKRGNVYIADYGSDKVLKLQHNGDVIFEVLNATDGISKPWSLACGNNGSLWVGGRSGKISVHQFKDSF